MVAMRARLLAEITATAAGLRDRSATTVPLAKIETAKCWTSDAMFTVCPK
jgi:hypothetical protein